MGTNTIGEYLIKIEFFAKIDSSTEYESIGVYYKKLNIDFMNDPLSINGDFNNGAGTSYTKVAGIFTITSSLRGAFTNISVEVDPIYTYGITVNAMKLNIEFIPLF